MKGRRDEIGLTHGRFRFNPYGVCLNPERLLSVRVSNLDWAQIELEIAHCPRGWIFGGTHINGASPCMIYPPYFATREECIRAGKEWLRNKCEHNIASGSDVAYNKRALAVLKSEVHNERHFIQLELF